MFLKSKNDKSMDYHLKGRMTKETDFKSIKLCPWPPVL